MGFLGNRLGVQAWSLRGLKNNQDVARMVKACGCNLIELDGAHCDFSNPARWDEVIRTYRDAGITIASFGVQQMKNKPDVEEKYFEFAKRAGAKFISAAFAVDTLPQGLRTAERMAESYDVRVAIHNHGAKDWAGSFTMLQHLLSQTNERIGLCFDTAWAMDSMMDPVAMVEHFGKRIHLLHLKDFLFDATRQPREVVVGLGNLKIRELLEALRKNKFSGHAVVEFECDPKNETSDLLRCVEMVRRADSLLGAC